MSRRNRLHLSPLVLSNSRCYVTSCKRSVGQEVWRERGRGGNHAIPPPAWHRGREREHAVLTRDNDSISKESGCIHQSVSHTLSQRAHSPSHTSNTDDFRSTFPDANAKESRPKVVAWSASPSPACFRQPSRSGLTMLSRKCHSVDRTNQGMSSHAARRGTLLYSRLTSLGQCVDWSRLKERN